MNEKDTDSYVDYGPLAHLIGSWQGNKGQDVSPEPQGQQLHPYYETLTYTAIGSVTNADTQQLAVLRYQQIVYRKADDAVFHDETGYWMWDAERSTVMHTLTIPRAVCVLAGGKWTTADSKDNTVSITVSAKQGDDDWGIIQSPFMRDQAKTVEFHHELLIKNEKLSYVETTVLDIYGKRFDHIDRNELSKS